MRLGESLEAAYTLRGPIAAGMWHIVGDAEDCLRSVAVRYDVIWRHGGDDTVIATATGTLTPQQPDPYVAAPFEGDAAGIAAPAAAGDKLVLRFTVTGGDADTYFIANGDGAYAHGRVPNLTLP